jgi:lysophospholipase L1-like esterase
MTRRARLPGYGIAAAFALIAAGGAIASAADFVAINVKGENWEDQTGLWACPKLGGPQEIAPLKVRLHATKESVTGGVALRVDIAKGSQGTVTYENSPFPAGSAGITLYAKASRELDMTIKGKASFTVTTEWKKIDLPWEKLGATRDKPDIQWEFQIGLSQPAAEDVWVVIDRLGTESPDFDPNPKIEPARGPDETINTKDLVGNAEVLAPTVARLKAKQPVRIIAFGDSVTAGAQMNRGNWGINKEDGVKFLYFSHLARLLEQKYGYTGVTYVQNGYGGYTSEQGKGLTDKVFADLAKDDLVIIEFGANDLGWANKSIDSWLGNLKAIADAAKQKTSQIIVTSPTTGGKVPQQAAEISKRIREFAAAEKLAYADITRWSMYRGEKFAWAYLANGYHPDFMGHMMMAEVMAPLLTGEHFDWPQYAAKK